MAVCDYALCGQCNKKLIYEGGNSFIRGDDQIYCAKCFSEAKAEGMKQMREFIAQIELSDGHPKRAERIRRIAIPVSDEENKI